jgi:hypothetical protein
MVFLTCNNGADFYSIVLQLLKIPPANTITVDTNNQSCLLKIQTPFCILFFPAHSGSTKICTYEQYENTGARNPGHYHAK